MVEGKESMGTRLPADIAVVDLESEMLTAFPAKSSHHITAFVFGAIVLRREQALLKNCYKVMAAHMLAKTAGVVEGIVGVGRRRDCGKDVVVVDDVMEI